MSDFKEKAPEIAAGLAQYLDSTLQESLSNADWKNEVSVQAKNSKISLVYEESEEGEVFDSEFGSEHQAHKSAIRPFLKESEGMMKNVVANAAINYLFENGLV